MTDERPKIENQDGSRGRAVPRPLAGCAMTAMMLLLLPIELARAVGRWIRRRKLGV